MAIADIQITFLRLATQLRVPPGDGLHHGARAMYAS